MRFLVLMSVINLLTQWSLQPASALDCADADPLRTAARVYGDFQITGDTDDPAHHLLYVNHVSNGPSSIVVARMNGISGQVESGTLTTIADNFQGKQLINGPEFVHPPGLGLGVLYRALDGVHGVFRPNAPRAWNDFTLDVKGALSTRSPPALSSTYPVSYEGGGLPLGQNTYTLLDGRCKLRCFASVRGGVPTDAARVFEKGGLTISSVESVVQGTSDGNIFAEACTLGHAANGICGIYQATIDGRGGFLAPPSLVIKLPYQAKPSNGMVPLAVGVHPVTKSNIVFLRSWHGGGETIDVYEQKSSAGPMIQIASVSASRSDHYRVVSDGETTMLLHYLLRNGNQVGSYIIPVTAASGNLRVGAVTKIADVANGAEVEYLKGAAKFAIFYRTSRQPSLIERCFFNP